jgi:Mg/Co/Ni transporter MgtE
MITDRVEKLLSDFRPEHSEFQMENFIIGGGHPWGQYKQALRELSARHNAMVESGEQIRKLKDEIARARRHWFNGRSVIEIEKLLDNAKRERKSKAREYLTFYRIARDLKRTLGEISPQRRRELEAEMWLDKARRMAALDLMTNGGIQRQTAEFLTSLPREQRREIFRELMPENRQKLLMILE